jgi:putative transcriptional regulator
MKKLSKEILARDAKRNIGEEVLEAIREIKAGGGRRFVVRVSQATEARIKLGQSQADFAAMLGVSVRT